jgi:hypothetical protein
MASPLTSERIWTDPRDQRAWRIRLTSTGEADNGFWRKPPLRLPPAIVRFDDLTSEGGERRVFLGPTPLIRDVKELSDAELMDLLDTTLRRAV